jgi:hypothetical protein
VAAGTFVLDVGRGVNGLLEPRLAMVAGGGGARVSFGGVGGLPVEGLKGVFFDELALSRGLRNISLEVAQARRIIVRLLKPELKWTDH